MVDNNTDESLKLEKDNEIRSFEDELFKNIELDEEADSHEVDLDLLEPIESIGELFEKINPLTIPSIILGVIILIITFTNVLENHPVWNIILGFIGGLSFVFGCSELIIFGVKGIGKKLGWSQYFMGIMAAIGADSSDIIVVSILLTRAKTLSATGITENIELANNLTVTSITLVLTTVLINMLILGITILVVARKKPFKLPKQLSQNESNLVLAMTIFSFILIAFGFTHNVIGIEQFDRVFQGAIGVSLLLFYILFIGFLIGDAREKLAERIGPQTLITEYFPEEDDTQEEGEEKKHPIKDKIKEMFSNGNDDETEQFISLRRFPWFVLVIVFVVGISGIIFGGTLISESIETGLEIYNLPILVYCVVIGFISSAPEMTITFRAILNPEEEDTEIGMIHQISSVNQTFFLLFGLPFLFASIINVNIPVALDTTLVLTGIFAISLALHLTIIDDNHFDRVEGALILVASIASLLTLAIVGGLIS
ncbi:MAG: hypothetical protein HZR80_17545 [Candidatus Heimdallarchaeota archaeon]